MPLSVTTQFISEGSENSLCTMSQPKMEALLFKTPSDLHSPFHKSYSCYFYSSSGQTLNFLPISLFYIKDLLAKERQGDVKETCQSSNSP